MRGLASLQNRLDLPSPPVPQPLPRPSRCAVAGPPPRDAPARRPRQPPCTTCRARLGGRCGGREPPNVSTPRAQLFCPSVTGFDKVRVGAAPQRRYSGCSRGRGCHPSERGAPAREVRPRSCALDSGPRGGQKWGCRDWRPQVGGHLGPAVASAGRSRGGRPCGAHIPTRPVFDTPGHPRPQRLGDFA